MPCRIIFGETTEGKTAITLDLDADDVGKRLLTNNTGFERFEGKEGEAIWVNVSNVLWVEPKVKGRAVSW